MGNVTLLINGREIRTDSNKTILEAATENGIHIPTLCFLKDCCNVAACRMCVVEVKGQRLPAAACITTVRDGIEVTTDSEMLRNYRRTSLDLMCRNHRMDCEYCSRYSDCEFHALMRELDMDERKYQRYSGEKRLENSLKGFSFDSSKCVLCRRCVQMCQRQGMNILAVLQRGKQAHIGSYGPLAETDCIQCGQCMAVCPTGALFERNDMMTLWNVMERSLPVTMILASEVGTTIGECFHEAIGTDCEGKLIGVLRRMGIRRVCTYQRSKPASPEQKLWISGCCPAVSKLIQNRYPDLEKYLSDEKMPVAVAVEAARRDGDFVVAVGGCTSGKSAATGADLYMTVTELAAFIRRGCVSRFTAQQIWRETEPSDFDAVIPVSAPSEDCVTVDNMMQIHALLHGIRSGEIISGHYELLACEGGCLMGGGTPRIASSLRNAPEENGRAEQNR